MAAHTTTTPGDAPAVNDPGRMTGTAALPPDGRPDRRRIEAAIEALIDVLDTMDGDTDLEPDADHEPGIPDPAAWHWPSRGRVLCAPLDVLLHGVRS